MDESVIFCAAAGSRRLFPCGTPLKKESAAAGRIFHEAFSAGFLFTPPRAADIFSARGAAFKESAAGTVIGRFLIGALSESFPSVKIDRLPMPSVSLNQRSAKAPEPVHRRPRHFALRTPRSVRHRFRSSGFCGSGRPAPAIQETGAGRRAPRPHPPGGRTPAETRAPAWMR